MNIDGCSVGAPVLGHRFWRRNTSRVNKPKPAAQTVSVAGSGATCGFSAANSPVEGGATFVALTVIRFQLVMISADAVAASEPRTAAVIVASDKCLSFIFLLVVWFSAKTTAAKSGMQSGPWQHSWGWNLPMQGRENPGWFWPP